MTLKNTNKPVNSTLQALRILRPATSSSSSNSLLVLLNLMVLINLAIRAYAQNVDTLLFETNSSTSDSFARFQFVTPQSSAGQGSSSSPLYFNVKTAIQNGLCNTTLGIPELPSSWSLIKEWDKYPQGTLSVGSQEKNHTNPIACVINLINSQRDLETNHLEKYGLPIFVTMLVFAIFGMATYSLLGKKISCQTFSFQPMKKFRDYLKKNKNKEEDDDEEELLPSVELLSRYSATV